MYVKTGDERFSGTDSNVYLRLIYGNDEKTNEYHLTHSKVKDHQTEFLVRNLFETGALDSFQIEIEPTIDNLKQIQVCYFSFPFLDQ